MRILPLRTPLIAAGDDIAGILAGLHAFADGDVLCVSSKVIAAAAGEAKALTVFIPTERAQTLADGGDARFVQAVLDETERMRGRVLDAREGLLLTELRPQGLRAGVLLAPNAGLDRSNIKEGMVIGWPADPAGAARRIRETVLERTGARIAVIVTDSCCHPARLGVTAFAMAVSGMDPVRSLLGEKDLFGRAMRVTHEAVADQLATAANAVMGNDAQRVPAAAVTESGIALTDHEGWVDGIEPDEDLFRILFRNGDSL